MLTGRVFFVLLYSLGALFALVAAGVQIRSGPVADRLWHAAVATLRFATTPATSALRILGLRLSWRVVAAFALGVAAFVWAARVRPWPPTGANPLLDLVAAADPLGYHAIRAWYLAVPGITAFAGVLALTGAWRVWLQGSGPGGARRGLLPPWPSPGPTGPRLVVGELHHPTVPQEIERPAWLTIPERV